MTRFLRRQEGFTLIELMVVVLIIGILVAIAIPVFASTQRNARRRACLASIRTAQGAIQQYDAEQAGHGGAAIATANMWTALTSSLTSQGVQYGPWLHAEPRCPTQGTYSVDAAGTITCTIHNTLVSPAG